MNAFESKIKSLLASSELGYWNEQQNIRIAEGEELFAFYTNSRNDIIQILKNRMYKGGNGIFKKETIERFPSFNYINPIPKILNILCGAYNKPVSRYILNGEEEDENTTKIYQDLISIAKLDNKIQEIYRLAKLYGLIHVMPVVRYGVLQYDILHPFMIDVETYKDDPLRIKQVAIKCSEWNEYTNKPEIFVIVWNEKENYRIDTYGNKLEITDEDGNKNEFKNPYGVIPIVSLRFDYDSYDYWGTGMSWLLEHCISMSIDNIYSSYVLPFHAGGIPYLQNLNIGSAEQNERGNSVIISGVEISRKLQGDEVRIAPDSILMTNQSVPDFPPSFEFKSPQSNIPIIKDFINWKRQMVLSDLNISSNAYALESKAQSGYAKMVEEMETINTRIKDIPYLRNFEQDLFWMTRIVANYNLDINLNENLTLAVDFQEVTFPKTPDEIMKERDLAIKYNTRTPIDFILEENPDLSYEQAEELYKSNLDINTKASNISIPISDELMQESQESTMTNENKLDFPELRQGDDFTCGASALQGVLMFYGEEYTESELCEMLGTSEENGTDESSIKQVAEKLGHTVDMETMDIEKVKTYITNGCPVILDIQAWSENEAVDYANDYEDGHYVVAIGFDESGFILEDPSAMTRQKISFEELEKRWHDIDMNGIKTTNLGIAIYGKGKKFDSTNIEEIG